MLEIRFRFLPLCYVEEADNRSHDLSVFSNRRGAVFDRQAMTIFSPEELIVDAAFFPVGVCRKHRTFFLRVKASIRAMLMNQRMRTLTDHFFGRVAESITCRGIYKGDASFS